MHSLFQFEFAATDVNENSYKKKQRLWTQMKKLNSYYDCISYNFSKETIQLFVLISIAIFLKRIIRYIILVYKQMTEAFLYAKKTLDLSQLTLQIILFGFIYLYTNNIQLLFFMDSYKHYYVFQSFNNFLTS